jgi:hypothetical protein
MTIDKYKTEDGYVDANGTGYDSAVHYFAIGTLGFCGCGMPEQALDHIRGALQLLADLEDKVWKGALPMDDWNVQVCALLPTYGARYFMWYFLDNKELTEHGGSVPGWLTDKGRELLSDLNELAEASWEEDSDAEEERQDEQLRQAIASDPEMQALMEKL